jgi:chromatin remodeling complex protein RSC6
MATDTPVTLELLAKELKALRKDVRKIRQTIEDPSGEKQAARSANNGFKKPQDVTPELRAFLGLAADEKISRADVTGRINKYVSEKGLKAGQNITLDDALKGLLKVPEGVQVTFLNIQKYINPHYVKDPNAPEKKPRAPKAPPAPESEAPKEKKARPKVAKAPAAA